MIRTTAKNHIFPLLLATLIASLFSINAQAASFKLNPINEVYANNCEQKTDIIINTESKSSNAAEIQIDFDSSKITILDSDPDLFGIQIEKGKAYSAFILNTVDNALGKINIVATSLQQDFIGEKIFGSIHFKSRTQSSTPSKFTIIYNGIGKTIDSNIADSNTGLDILSSIQDAEYTFSNTIECVLNPSITTSPTTTPINTVSPTVPTQSTNPIRTNLGLFNNLGNIPIGLFNLLSLTTLSLLILNIIYKFIYYFIPLNANLQQNQNSNHIKQILLKTFPLNIMGIITLALTTLMFFVIGILL